LAWVYKARKEIVLREDTFEVEEKEKKPFEMRRCVNR
jgi:hypothetical protein